MQIDQLVLELTRRCNLKCEHCLRGNAQNKDIDTNVIKQFFDMNNIKHINDLTFTGGEPCLNPKAMIEIVNHIEATGIGIGLFYMATNGTVFDYRMIEPLYKLHDMVWEHNGEENLFNLMISEDEYHENEGRVIHPAWGLINHGTKRGPEYKHVMAEGRGKVLNPQGMKVKEYDWIWDDEGDRMDEGMIYINALGMIVKDCDYSYTTQKKRTIGHCLSKKLKEF